MIRLDSITVLRITLSAAVTTNQLPVDVSYSDKGVVSYNGGSKQSITNGTTAVDICNACSADVVQRDIDTVQVLNKDTTSKVVTISKYDGTTTTPLYIVTLNVGDQLSYTHAESWTVRDSTGSVKGVGAVGPPGPSATVFGEVPSGAIDGSNLIYTTALNFSSIGVYYAPSIDEVLTRLTTGFYSITGANEITLTFSPPVGSILIVDYSIA